jgi:hypothetical protein
VHAVRLLLVATALAANPACRGCSEPAFVQLTQAQRLVSGMRINFAKASDASDRAVMADTDEESIKLAREAEAADDSVSAAMPPLAQLLTDLRSEHDSDMLARFQGHFARYRALDREILRLAVANTNLKAQHLLFGPVSQVADEFCRALRALAAAAPASTAHHIFDATARAQLAVREILALQAPHIAEAQDSEMDRIEKEMAVRKSIAREALASIERNVRPPSRSSLDAAKASLDSFEALSRKLIELSRKNTNVRSLELALKQKPALAAACDESLVALQNALASEGFTGTR